MPLAFRKGRAGRMALVETLLPSSTIGAAGTIPLSAGTGRPIIDYADIRFRQRFGAIVPFSLICCHTTSFLCIYFRPSLPSITWPSFMRTRLPAASTW